MAKTNPITQITQAPFLLEGEIMHHRLFPKRNKFSYKSTHISFPLSQLDKLKKRLFKLNGFNLFGFYPQDYTGSKDRPVDYPIKKVLADYNIEGVTEVVLVTHPRIVGYVFNPVSFWLCFNNRSELIAVLSDVNNTCDQNHKYLTFKENLAPITSSDWISAEKSFYVSPFMNIEGEYWFRFVVEGDQFATYLNYFVDGQLKLSTYLKCRLIEFSDANLLWRFIKIPLATLKTTFLIHYQALRLLLKSIPYESCPDKLENDVTVGKKQNRTDV